MPNIHLKNVAFTCNVLCRLEYAEFLHTPEKRYDDFDEVCREIERQTDRLCGNNKGIMDRPISLTIRSPHGTSDRYIRLYADHKRHRLTTQQWHE